MLKFFFMMWNLIKTGPLDPLLEVNIFLLNKKKKNAPYNRKSMFQNKADNYYTQTNTTLQYITWLLIYGKLLGTLGVP